MQLRDRVLELVRNRYEQEDAKLRVYEIARLLEASKKDVTEAIDQLIEKGNLQYMTSPCESSYICPVISRNELLKRRVVNLVREGGRTEITQISRLLAENRDEVGEITSTLVQEGKIKFAGEGGSSWIEAT